MNRYIRWGLIVIIGIFGIIQLIPYGRHHSNPAVISEPPWDNINTRDLAVRACFDCHSNETKWPWYSNVAPVSWIIQRHVDEGRQELNFSEWSQSQEATDDVVGSFMEGEMPTWDYLLIHPEARLSEQERQAFIQGLQVTFPETGRNKDDR